MVEHGSHAVLCEDCEVGDVDSNDASGGKDNGGLGDFVLSDGTELIGKGDQLV